MKNIICAANWKLHKNPQQSKVYFEQFLQLITDEESGQFIFFPPAMNLMTTAESLSSSQCHWGAQNIYFEATGAFTGENSAQVVAEMGGTHVLVGHSERRNLFSEPDDWMAKKVLQAQKHKLVPILCVGELDVQRETGSTDQVISDQLKQGLALANLEAELAIAYEPVWAIGTGKVATPEVAEEAHQILREQLTQLAGREVADRTPILYGGSVKPGNSLDLAKQDNINGFLVGGASLEPESFVQIFRNASH